LPGQKQTGKKYQDRHGIISFKIKLSGKSNSDLNIWLVLDEGIFNFSRRTLATLRLIRQ